MPVDKPNRDDEQNQIIAQDLYLQIGQLILKERIARNISRHDLGRRLGVSHTLIFKWERAVCRIPVHNLIELSNIFRLPLSYFTGKS